MDHAVSGVPAEAWLLQGCCRGAERADQVSIGLDQLRLALAESFHGHIRAVIEEMRKTAQLLRDLADRSRVHAARVPVILDYLAVVLPCLERTLRDITTFYDDKTSTREIRWRKMYHKMAEETDGLPLPHRFVLYSHFLSLLMQLLIRSPHFDLNTLDKLRTRILELREQRGIPPPPPMQAGPLVRQTLMMMPSGHDPSIHWAEQIFSLPLPSRTAFKTTKLSKSYGPLSPYGAINIPPESKILFKRSFNDDRLAVLAFLNLKDQVPYIISRTMQGDMPLFSLRGAHELVIGREGNALQLKRWSLSDGCEKLWAVLYFQTWEEMVLFYCTFLSLKARNTLTVQVSPEEYKLSREKRLFQAQIRDDRYSHSLIVYEDNSTGGIRLHAAVWDGELRQCPVWTAFVTHQSKSATWLKRRSKHRVWLTDVQLYVFCERYRQENMRQNKAGAFEIYFVSEEGARRFRDVFAPISAGSPAASETNDADLDGDVPE